MEDRGSAQVPSFSSFQPLGRQGESRKTSGHRKKGADKQARERGHKKGHRKTHEPRRSRADDVRHANKEAGDAFFVDARGDVPSATYGPSQHTTPRFYRGSTKSGRSKDALPAAEASMQDAVDEQAPLFSAESPQEQSKQLHARLLQDPADLDAWMALVHLQRAFLGGTSKKNATEPQRRTLAEMQLAVIERAKQAAPSNATSLTLQLAWLRIATESGLWDGEQLEQQWKRAITEYTSQPHVHFEHISQLWWSYVLFCKTHWSTFTMDCVVQAYSDALHATTRIAEQLGPDGVECSTHQFALVSDLCGMLHSAGYAEWGFAIVQALFEFQLGFFRDVKLQAMSAEDVCNIFSAWWDEEHARIGDMQAYTGFSRMNSASTTIPLMLQDECTHMGHDAPPSPLQPTAAWCTAELDRGMQKTPMALTEADDASQDPYSFVFAQDIASFLYAPLAPLFPAILLAADTMLQHIGLPVHWLCSALAFGQFCLPMQNVLCMPSLRPDRKQSRLPDAFWDASLHHDVASCFSVGPQTLFPRSENDPRCTWFCTLPRVSAETASIAERILCEISSMLTQQGAPIPAAMVSLPQAMLCMARDESRRAKKALRAALQCHDRCVTLWYAYAELEAGLGNTKGARRVCMEILGSFGEVQSDEDAYGIASLWALWVQLEKSTDLDACAHVLHAAATSRLQSAPSRGALAMPTSALSTSEKDQVLGTLRRRVASLDTKGPDMYVAPALAYCLATAERMFVAVQVADSLTRPAAVYRSILDAFAHASGTMERMRAEVGASFQYFVHEYKHDTLSTAFRPRELRAITAQLLEIWPENSIYVHFLVLQEQHDRLENYARTTIEHTVLRSWKAGSDFAHAEGGTGLSRTQRAELAWVLAIRAELILSRANENRVRNVVDRALDAVRHSSLLWHIAIEYEMRVQSPSRQERIKTLVYQGIRACPYDKSLYLLPFHTALQNAFTAQELHTLVVLQEEKELRVFSDLAGPACSSDQDTMDRISAFVDNLAADTPEPCAAAQGLRKR
ncbi:hypothetical protein MVES1_001156 [Malassezia vespertilionis]|uniref:uncharacterized protein n=1 Tax=Malassezia vespertilionis TaxID=2020962 RepID=UPI0024B17765|nr:uncharacterized protein MVES1_001156 [Malassezia vespertilionis]WFD05822.1 hypothetical protein MVES1_001156 [Malassezia vespertilionis]